MSENPTRFFRIGVGGFGDFSKFGQLWQIWRDFVKSVNR